MSPFSERLDIPIQDECMLEAKSRITQLEDRKSGLEKKWDSQVSEVVSFFQELYSKLEARQTALLEQLSHMYHALMTPLQEAIRQLEQTVSYTGYVGVLSRYSQVAGIGDRIGDRIMDISMFVADYTLPTDPYMVNVDKVNKHKIAKSVKGYLNLSKESIPAAEPIQCSFLPKRNISFQLGQNFNSLIKPSDKVIRHIGLSDIAFNPTTNIFYALFDKYWKTYHQIHVSLKEIQIIKITNPVSFPINSSIALLNNSVLIMANNIMYVYSEKGEVLKQFQIQIQIGLSFDNPKIYTFAGINSIYIASIESPHINKVNSQNGANEGGIKLTTKVLHLHSSTVYANFADMVRSTTQLNQLLIMYTTYPTNSPPQSNTTNNQYYIQTYDINSMQCTGVYSLSQQMSPFCCLTALSDTLYILDICTGSVHNYLFSQMTDNKQFNIHYGGICNKYNYYSWKQHSHGNRFPKCTDAEGRKLKHALIRAFYCEYKKKLFFYLVVNCTL